MATSSVQWNAKKIEAGVRNYITRGARKAGRLLRDDARQRAPRRTGLLKKSIRHAVRSSRRQKKIIIRVGFLPAAFYGRFLQLGTTKLAPREIINLQANQRAIVQAILRGGR